MFVRWLHPSVCDILTNQPTVVNYLQLLGVHFKCFKVQSCRKPTHTGLSLSDLHNPQCLVTLQWKLWICRTYHSLVLPVPGLIPKTPPFCCCCCFGLYDHIITKKKKKKKDRESLITWMTSGRHKVDMRMDSTLKQHTKLYYQVLHC